MLTLDSLQSGPIAPSLRLECSAPPPPTVEHCYRNLVAAILLQAKKDLAEPGYRGHAARWLRSGAARSYAELLGIDPSALSRLQAGRGAR